MKNFNPKRLFDDYTKDLRDPEFMGLLFFAVVFLAIGTVFYMIVENWDIVQSFYFTVTTLTTVGYGDLHPTSDLSRMFTSFYALIGIGFILGLVTVGARRAVDRVSKHNDGSDNQEK